MNNNKNKSPVPGEYMSNTTHKKNKSPVPGEYMSNTTHKTEERRFQEEERRDVMKMNKMFAGLIAFVAGVALSAGSAFATNGYTTGDSAMNKLVPYFETGDNRATLIAIQNMSPQETSTIALNADVTDIQVVLDGEQANTNAAGLITGFDDGNSLCADDAACTPGQTQDPTKKANAEAALETAMMMAYSERVFVTVNVYNAEGVMMEGASATLCLSENQSGYVVLQGPEMQDWQMEIPNQGQILTVMDGDIPEYGYAQVMAGDTKYQACSSATPAGIKRVVTDSTATADAMYAGAMSEVATWTIVQDTGMGFFGTEVPTASITMIDHDSDQTTPDEIACYTADATADPVVAAQTGLFHMPLCGLVPERHMMGALDSATTTNNANAYARYDAMDDSMVYMWLAAGMDTDTTLPKDRRMLQVTVMCLDGTMPAGPDRDGDNQPDPIMVAAPNMVTMIDPADMDGLGMYTDMCDDSRGMLKITMPNNSHAGMVFTHIAQAGNSYRMNFQGYSKASPDDTCSTTLPAGAPASACK